MNRHIADMKGEVKGIIFDYGGTIDSGGDHWSEVIWNSWQDAGVEAEKDEFREVYVWAERELARTRHILPHHNFLDLLQIKMRLELGRLDEIRKEKGLESIDAVVKERWADHSARYCYQVARGWVEKARPVLEALKSRFPMVLVSNFYGNVESVLRDFDLLKYFDSIVESAVVGVRKPDPAIFGLGVDALGLKAEDVLVVGDSLTKDIMPARSLGCKTAWLKGKGWTPEEDARQDASQISSLSDLLQLLDD